MALYKHLRERPTIHECRAESLRPTIHGYFVVVLATELKWDRDAYL